jgi:hypothetical protein
MFRDLSDDAWLPWLAETLRALAEVSPHHVEIAVNGVIAKSRHGDFFPRPGDLLAELDFVDESRRWYERRAAVEAHMAADLPRIAGMILSMVSELGKFGPDGVPVAQALTWVGPVKCGSSPEVVLGRFFKDPRVECFERDGVAWVRWVPWSDDHPAVAALNKRKAAIEQESREYRRREREEFRTSSRGGKNK